MKLKIGVTDLLLRSSLIQAVPFVDSWEETQDLVLSVIRPDWERVVLVKRFMFSCYEVPGTESLVKITSILGFKRGKNEALAIHGSNEIHSVSSIPPGVDIETYGEVLHVSTSPASRVVVEDLRFTQEIMLRVLNRKTLRQRDELLSFVE